MTGKAGAVALLGLALIGCGEDPVGPDPELAIDVRVAVTRVTDPFIRDLSDGPTISCDVYLTATATGVGEALWQDAIFRWYAGVDRSIPFDSSVVPAAHIRDSWDRQTLSAGQTATATWRIGADVPFALGVEFGYAPALGSGRQTTSIEFTCGPEIPAATAPPEITGFAVRNPWGPVEPGDTIVVDFTATSAVGLWQTAVVLSGPCDAALLFTERLAPTATRSVRVPLADTCSLGIPIVVGVFALDAAMQEGGAVRETGWVTMDGTPPEIFNQMSLPVEGLRFVGESINLVIGASDNFGLRALVWEALPSGDRDSLVLSSTSVNHDFWMPVLPTWVGDLTLRAWARDAAGLTSDTVVLTPTPLRILPTISRPTMTATAPGEPIGIRVDERRGRVYLLQANPHAVVFLNAASLAMLETVALPVEGLDFDFSAGGDSLLVTLGAQGALGIVDLGQAPTGLTVLPLSSLDSTVDQYPRRVRSAANGKAFVTLAGYGAAAHVLLEVDLAGGTERIRTDAGYEGGVGLAFLESSHDRSVIILNGPGIQRYEAAIDAFGPLSGASALQPSVDGAGSYVVVAKAVYDRTLTYLHSIEGGQLELFTPVALAPAGDYAYVSASNSVRRARLSNGRYVDRTSIPSTPGRLRVSADGTLLVTTQWTTGSTLVVAVDLR